MLKNGKAAPGKLENLPSERSFGFLFAMILCGAGLYSVLYGNWNQFAEIALLGTGIVLFLIAILIPRILAPFNKAWFLLGMALGKIVSPIVLGLIFFLLITPVALIGKVIGRDELKLKKRKVDSYWVDRKQPESMLDSFKNQF